MRSVLKNLACGLHLTAPNVVQATGLESKFGAAILETSSILFDHCPLQQRATKGREMANENRGSSPTSTQKGASPSVSVGNGASPTVGQAPSAPPPKK